MFAETDKDIRDHQLKTYSIPGLLQGKMIYAATISPSGKMIQMVKLVAKKKFLAVNKPKKGEKAPTRQGHPGCNPAVLDASTGNLPEI